MSLGLTIGVGRLSKEYGDTPFGLLIRETAELDHDAAMEAFSASINDASLNQN